MGIKKFYQVLAHYKVLEMGEAIFQQYGVSHHYANSVKQFLNNNLPGHWIGRRSQFLDCPSQSLDLTVFDFSYGAFKGASVHL